MAGLWAAFDILQGCEAVGLDLAAERVVLSGKYTETVHIFT